MPAPRALASPRQAVAAALCLLLGSGLLGWLWSRYPSAPPAALLLSPPASHSALAASRCPPRTLQDHGVCIPVPITQEQQSEIQLVPLLPGRPAELSAYHLPAPGAAQLVNTTEAELVPRFRIPGQALALRVGEAVPISGADLVGLDAATVLGSDRSAGWLMLYQPAPTPTLVLLSGLVDLMPELVSGKPLPPGSAFAKTAPMLFMAARQLPATSSTPSVEDFREGHSVPTDVRNVLQPKAAPSP